MTGRKCRDCSNQVTEINVNTGNFFSRCPSCLERNNETSKTHYRKVAQQNGRLPVDFHRAIDPMETYLRTKLSRYAGMPDWEDAIQEALIQTWKDRDKGLDKRQLEARAVIRGKAIILHQTGMQGGATMTGHVGRKSTEGVVKAAGALKREKIRNYVDEFESLHDRTPNNREIGDALGMAPSAVGKYIRSMQGNGVSVPLDQVKLDTLYSDDNSGEEDVTRVIDRNPVTWESDTIDSLTIKPLIATLTDKQRQAIFYTYWMGMTNREVAAEMGISQAVARGHLLAAYERMRKELV